MDHVETAAGRFAILAEGDPAAPLVLCLHGFPDHAPTMRRLLADLSASGFRAVAPWLRGYAPSVLEGPHHVDRLAQDAIDLGDALSPRRPFALVGHDWGAAATYSACQLAPERIWGAVTLALPHPLAFLANLPRLPAQLGRSWYMIFFQLARSPTGRWPPATSR